MSRLTSLSLSHRTVIMLLALLTVGLGGYAATSLKQEMLPSMDLPTATILTVLPGASPEVVELELSQPIEAAVRSVDGVTQVASASTSGVSRVTVQWEYGRDAEELAADLRGAVDAIGATLPDGVDPRVITGNVDDVPVLVLALASDIEPAELSTLVDDLVAPELKGVEGVRDVATAGQQASEIVVSYDPGKLRKRGVDPAAIAQFLAANATALPSGVLETAEAGLTVQTGTTFASLDDLANLRLQGAAGPVALKQVATVAEQPVRRTSLSRVNGRPALTLSITKTTGANIVSVSHDVHARLDALAGKLGGNTEFVTIFDQAPFIERSIHDLSVEGGVGLAMAVLVVLLFLRSLRPTLVTAISIPLSLLIALVGLLVGEHTLNILTLGALTAAIGRVVDDSIVVVENIKRHHGEGETGASAILAAVTEVAGAVTASTLTTVAVFGPIGMIGGLAGELFRPFALTITVALLASLLVSLTVVPVLAGWLLRPKPGAATAARGGEHQPDTLLQKCYLPVLGWSLRHRAVTLLLAVAVLGGTVALAPSLKTDFIGSLGQKTLQLGQELEPGASLARTDAAARQVEALLAAEPDVLSYQTLVGGSSSVFSSSMLGGASDTNTASHTVALADTADVTTVIARLREAVAGRTGVGRVDIATAEAADSNQVMVYVEGPDADRLAAGNAAALTMMQGIDGLSGVRSDLSEARKLLRVDVDDARAAKLGMTRAQIGQSVARALRGQQIGTLTRDDRTLEVYLRSQQPASSVDDLQALELPLTQKMIADARQRAADRLDKRSDKLQQRIRRDTRATYDDQAATLRKERGRANRSSDKLTRQLTSAKRQLRKLQGQLAKAQRAAEAGADPTTVSQTVFQLTQAVGGVTQKVVQLSQGVAAADAQAKAYRTQLRTLEEQRTTSSQVWSEQDALAKAADGIPDLLPKPARLADVAEVSSVDAANQISRVDGVRAITLTATVEGDDLGATTDALDGGIAGLDLPDGVTVRIGGVSEDQEETFAQLGLAMAIAVALVYLVMVATFGSMLQPLILLVSVPFAVTGAGGLSLVTDTALSLSSMIGLLMLIGIVVTNAIVLIDLINKRRRAGAGVDEAILAGARLRVRPIVMTALATICALLPMSLGLTGGGLFISKPLAIVVIGGLLSSTLLTLILVPVLYDLVEKGRQRRADRVRG